MNNSVLLSPLPDESSELSKEGFAGVASWIARDCDGDALVYRKFDELGARNLLYLQSELLALENELKGLDKEDALSSDMVAKDAARTWETLISQDAANNEKAGKRLKLIKLIRGKIKEYHEALLLQREIAKLKQPSNRVLDTYRTWLLKPYPVLGGQAKRFLDHPQDLVSLHSSSEDDYLSSFLRQYWPVKAEVSRDGLHKIGRYNERSISIAVGMITIIVAAILLVGSITSLYLVQNDAYRLGMVAAFTAAFAMCIGLLTTARRAEVFAATAAYTAVLVVFISGDISSSSESPS
ncbi:hypothetical protein CC79DRAFT_1395407 [Sarocladium strictum]